MDDMVLVAYHSWTTSLHRIKSIDADNKLVHFINPCNWSFGYFEKQQRYHVEFVAAGLDSPGEWYLDRATGILSYYPRPGEDMAIAKVIAPFPEELLKLQGDPEADKFVEYLHFQGLNFEYTDWTMPLTGKVDNQAAHDLETSAIHVYGARHCLFTKCQVAHTGGFGIWLSLGCQDDRIEQCHLYDLGAGGVRIGPAEMVTWLDRRVRKSEPPYENDPPLPPPLRADRNVVFNCFIHDGGNVYYAGVGIMIGRGSYNKISHNEVCDFYYSGISVGWCWEYIPSSAHHNLIQYLRIAGHKKKRKRYGKRDFRGKIPNRIGIEKRLRIVDAKKRLGDWEADTLIGQQHRGAVINLVERKSQFTLLGHVTQKTADAVQRQTVAQLRPPAASTVTWAKRFAAVRVGMFQPTRLSAD